jgi:hypothetical protein
MKRSNEQNPQNNYNDYYSSQENLYGTQTLADNLHRQNKSPNSQQKNNWNMSQPISHDNNEYYQYSPSPLKEGNYYNTQPRDPYRNNNLQESARGKLDQNPRNNFSPRSKGQDTNHSMLTPESSRANLYQSHLAKTGPVKKQEIPVIHHKLDQSGYGGMRKSVKAIPSPKNNGGSISTYAQLRQNNIPAQKMKPDYDKRGGPVQYQKQGSQQMVQHSGSQRAITPHPRPSNKDPYHNNQNMSTDYHYNQNNDIDMNPISVNLNLNELLEEADRSVSYSQTGGNPHNPHNQKHSQYLPPHLNYTNPFNNNNPHQPTQSHSAHAVAPKHLEDTGFHDENSQFDKVNGSLVLSRYENQLGGLDDLHDNSMNHSIGQFNVDDSYTQANNPSKYRGQAMNYQQQHLQLSGLNNNHNQYNPNMNHMGGMAYD